MYKIAINYVIYKKYANMVQKLSPPPNPRLGIESCHGVMFIVFIKKCKNSPKAFPKRSQ